MTNVKLPEQKPVPLMYTDAPSGFFKCEGCGIGYQQGCPISAHKDGCPVRESSDSRIAK